MKIKLDEDAMQNLEYWINISGQNKSFAVECDNNYKSWVAEPVIKHCLAPRDARACLEMFGIMADAGIKVHNVLMELKKIYFESI